MSSSEISVKHANSVYYTAVSDGTLVTRRTTKRHHTIDKVYSCSPEPESRQLEFKFDLGSEYVDGFESYLKFELKYSTYFITPAEPLPAKLSSGFTDLIQDILLIDRNGTELERIENFYQIASMLATSTHTSDSLHNGSYVFPIDKRVAVTPATTTVLIPLHFLLGIFRTNTLVPPHILDKATLRIRLRNANLVFSPTTTTVPVVANSEGWRYSVTDPEIVMYSYNLDHRLHDLITAEYNSTGLHFPFESHTHIGYDIPNNEKIDTLQITQSFSRATKVLMAIDARTDDAPHLDAYFNNTLPVEVNEREPGPWIYSSLQCKINDVTWPDSPVSEFIEAYQLWLSAFKAHRGVGVSAQAKLDFLNGQRVCIDLDRGTVGHKSGQIISNKFPVSINMNLREAKVHHSINTAMFSRVLNRRLHAFVEHQRIILAKSGNHSVLV